MYHKIYKKYFFILAAGSFLVIIVLRIVKYSILNQGYGHAIDILLDALVALFATYFGVKAAAFDSEQIAEEKFKGAVSAIMYDISSNYGVVSSNLKLERKYSPSTNAIEKVISNFEIYKKMSNSFFLAVKVYINEAKKYNEELGQGIVNSGRTENIIKLGKLINIELTRVSKIFNIKTGPYQVTPDGKDALKEKLLQLSTLPIADIDEELEAVGNLSGKDLKKLKKNYSRHYKNTHS